MKRLHLAKREQKEFFESLLKDVEEYPHSTFSVIIGLIHPDGQWLSSTSSIKDEDFDKHIELSKKRLTERFLECLRDLCENDKLLGLELQDFIKYKLKQ